MSSHPIFNQLSTPLSLNALTNSLLLAQSISHPNNLIRLSDVDWAREVNGDFRIDDYWAVVGNLLLLRRLELYELDTKTSDAAEVIALDYAREQYRRGVRRKIPRPA